MNKKDFLIAFNQAYSAKDGTTAKQKQSWMAKLLDGCVGPTTTDVTPGNITNIYEVYRQNMHSHRNAHEIDQDTFVKGAAAIETVARENKMPIANLEQIKQKYK